MKRTNRNVILLLGVFAGSALGQTVVCPVTADTWIETPQTRRGEKAAAPVIHGSDRQLVINGRSAFALLQFDTSKLSGLKVDRAVLRIHQQPGLTPLSTVGLSTISGSGPWNESATYGQTWAYRGSDLADVTFGPGGSLYAYPAARAVKDGWFEIDVAPRLVVALATGDQFGWILSDEKGQTRTRHVLSSREGQYPPVLVVETSPGDRTAPGPVRSLGAAGRSKLSPGSVALHFGGAGDAARYELRYSREPIDKGKFDRATVAPRWGMDPLAPKPSWDATENSLRDEVHGVIENLEPGAVYYFAARAIDACGHIGPVSSLGQHRAYARTFPKLPERPAGRAISQSAAAAGDSRIGIWAAPELLKIDAKTGVVLEKSEGADYRTRNRVWNAATSTVRLIGARNEFVAFQLAVESGTPVSGIEVKVAKSPFEGARVPAVFRKSGVVQLYREWFVPDDLGWYADALVPVTGSSDFSAADNAVPGQTVQPFFVDVYIPHGVSPGLHSGSLTVNAAGGQIKTVKIEVEVLPLTLPDKLNFIVDLNGYGGVNSGLQIEQNTPEYRKLLQSFHRMAHLHRTNLDILGYSQNGSVERGQAPPLSGEGAATKVSDWSEWDAHFGPLLDGSAFSDLPRASVPITNMYLAFFENWPGDLRKSYRFNNYPVPKTTEEYAAIITRHALEAEPIEKSFTKEYQDRFSAVIGQFAEHFRQRKWLQTKYFVYLNDKYYGKDPARNKQPSAVSWWLLDEPNHRDDYRAISFFAWLTERGLRQFPDVPIQFRADISYVDFIRDLLAGQLDLTCSSPHFYTKNRLIMEDRTRFGKTHWNYATSNHPRETNVSMRAWCWRTWISGGDGLLPWSSVRGSDAWNRAEPLTVFYPGSKFGVNEPFASLRLKAYRRGQQDMEYAIMLSRKAGWDREAVARAVAGSSRLAGSIEQRFEEDAGVVTFQQADDRALDNLRLRIAAALLER